MSLLDIYDKIWHNRQLKVSVVASIQSTLDEIAELDEQYNELRGDAMELFKMEGSTSVPSDGRGTLSYISYIKRKIPIKVAEEVLDKETLEKIVVEESIEFVKWTAPKEKEQ